MLVLFSYIKSRWGYWYNILLVSFFLHKLCMTDVLPNIDFVASLLFWISLERKTAPCLVQILILTPWQCKQVTFEFLPFKCAKRSQMNRNPPNNRWDIFYQTTFCTIESNKITISCHRLKTKWLALMFSVNRNNSTVKGKNLEGPITDQT